MYDKALFNTVELSPHEQEILELNYLLFRERSLRTKEGEFYEIRINKLKSNNIIDLFKKEIGYSKLEKSVKITEESFQEFGISTNTNLFLICAFYDLIDSLLSRKY